MGQSSMATITCVSSSTPSTFHRASTACHRANVAVWIPACFTIEFRHLFGCMGYGEGDLAHKLRAMTHAAKVRTGSDTALRAWRWAQVGACTDQGGADKLLADTPCLTSPDSAAEIARQLMECGSKLSASEIDSYMFPRMIHCTGPLHITWNAYQSACQASEGWGSFEEVLRAVCAF